ncbi:MAG: tetraacyldisaccharide 4'-kinase [Flavobacteriaceae bacterium]|nr:tetraacyldisaccharide 4'-kinase [Flavobacteriaceae bacterium]
MNKLRQFLFPFSILYRGVTHFRNTLYNQGVLKSNEFKIPLIVVGNLRVGGTGKTPMVAYLIQLLKPHYRVAVLSRGYKRLSKGFVLADANTLVEDLGDEPYQLFRQHPNSIVAVDADRTHGVEQLMQLPVTPDVILLDDAFQHRQIKADFNILLTSYDDLYVDDTHLPSGNLRESVQGAERAQVIMVTKCPFTLTETEMFETAQKLKPALTQTVYFSGIRYADAIVNAQHTIPWNELVAYKVVLVTGIDNPKPLLNFLQAKAIQYTHLEFPDHHHFSPSDWQKMDQTFKGLNTNKKLFLTTEKDYVRIFATLSLKKEAKVDDWYYVGIETQLIQHQNDFNKLILDYVEQSTRNRSISER